MTFTAKIYRLIYGGGHLARGRVILNLATVFFLTGIWHGAGLGYVVWGAINGLCVIFEKCVKNIRIVKDVPKVLKWSVTMLIVMLFWQFFCWGNIRAAVYWYSPIFN